jgi:hypothetical protein
MVNKYFKAGQIGKELFKKNWSKKTKGNPEKDPNVRRGIAMGLKSMKQQGFIGIKSKKRPHDLSYLKGILKAD